jgi:uncharacterized protein YqgV (UPF0045/DUF77 family)
VKTTTISAQVSLYPLRQDHLGPAISKVADVLRASGLDVRPGNMSTIVAGETDNVFDSLKASFQSAAALGDVVMIVSVSNCCPVTPAEQRSA